MKVELKLKVGLPKIGDLNAVNPVRIIFLS